MNRAIKEELEEMGSSLGGLQKGMPYEVPQGYFDSLQENSAGQFMLPGKAMPHEVPAGYFAQLPDTIARKAHDGQRRGIVISFRQLRWAAAAVVLIAVMAGGINLVQTSNNRERGFLASVADRDIKDYLVNNYRPVPEPVKEDKYLDGLDISTNDIITYLDENGWGNENYY